MQDPEVDATLQVATVACLPEQGRGLGQATRLGDRRQAELDAAPELATVACVLEHRRSDGRGRRPLARRSAGDRDHYENHQRATT